jgi:hypothetical protein
MQAHESWFRSSPRTISTRDGALRLENFRVTQLTTGDDDIVVDRPVAAVSEGPHDVYRVPWQGIVS